MAAGRNDPCPCGSGRKSKQCCGASSAAQSLDLALGRRELERALQSERRGDLSGAIAGYRRAAAFPETAAKAQSRLGHLLLIRGSAREAVEALRAAAEADPGDPARRLDLVRALITEKQDVQAEAEIRGVLAGAPRDADAWWLLGRILSEAGRFREARAAFERAVEIAPRQGAAYYDLVRCEPLTEADRPLVTRMLAESRRVGDTDQRVRLHLALSKAFDDLGDYGAASTQARKAAELRGGLARFDRAGLARRIDRIAATFTREAIAARSAGGDPSALPILVVGMPRSGTTLVEQILSAHPEVAGAGELQFWPRCGEAWEGLPPEADWATFQRDAAAVCRRTLADLGHGAARVIDKNPFNFLWLGLARAIFPRALIVHCRRSPLDTCLSIQSTYFSPRTDFSTAAEDLVFIYRQYERLMAHWRAALPPDGFVEIEYEALVEDPGPQIRRLVGATGLPWNPSCLSPESNNRVVRTASKWQARQPIGRGSVQRWRRYAPWLGPLAQLQIDTPTA